MTLNRETSKHVTPSPDFSMKILTQLPLRLIDLPQPSLWGITASVEDEAERTVPSRGLLLENTEPRVLFNYNCGDCSEVKAFLSITAEID